MRRVEGGTAQVETPNASNGGPSPLIMFQSQAASGFEQAILARRANGVIAGLSRHCQPRSASVKHNECAENNGGEKACFALVPKQSLGTHFAKLCFASSCSTPDTHRRETEFRGRRSQTEFGNEEPNARRTTEGEGAEGKRHAFGLTASLPKRKKRILGRTSQFYYLSAELISLFSRRRSGEHGSDGEWRSSTSGGR